MPEMKLLPNQLKEAAYHRTHYAACPAPGTTVDDITNNDYWTHVAKKLRPGTLIEVLPEDMTFFATLIVLWVGQNVIRVKLLNFVNLTDEVAESEEEEGQHKVSWRNGKNWCVMRKTDGAIIKENLPSKKDALIWLADLETGQMTGN